MHFFALIPPVVYRLSSLAKFQDNLDIQRFSWNTKIFDIISCTFIVTDCGISDVLTPMLQRLNSLKLIWPQNTLL